MLVLPMTCACYATTEPSTLTLGELLLQNGIHYETEEVFLKTTRLTSSALNAVEQEKTVYMFTTSSELSSRDENGAFLAVIPLSEQPDGSLEGVITSEMVGNWLADESISLVNNDSDIQTESMEQTYLLTNIRGSSTPVATVVDTNLTVTIYATYYSFSLWNHNASGYGYYPVGSYYKFSTATGVSYCTLSTEIEGQTARYISELSTIAEYAPFFIAETESPSLVSNSYYLCYDYEAFEDEYPGQVFQIYGTGSYVCRAYFRYNGHWEDLPIVVAGSLAS